MYDAFARCSDRWRRSRFASPLRGPDVDRSSASRPSVYLSIHSAISADVERHAHLKGEIMRSSFLKSVVSTILIVGTFALTTPVTYAAAPRPAQKQQNVARDGGSPFKQLIRIIRRIISQDQPVIPIP